MKVSGNWNDELEENKQKYYEALVPSVMGNQS